MDATAAAAATAVATAALVVVVVAVVVLVVLDGSIVPEKPLGAETTARPGSCQISSKGAEELRKGLRNNRTLNELGLQGAGTLTVTAGGRDFLVQ